jgi:hypothetical protein
VTESFMFEGELIKGRLSNEIWLHKNCPQEFYDPRNEWTAYARNIFAEGGDFRNWNRKQEHAVEQEKKSICFVNLLYSANSLLRPEVRIFILGWMLSEMLTEVPIHRPFPYEYHDH